MSAKYASNPLNLKAILLSKHKRYISSLIEQMSNLTVWMDMNSRTTSFTPSLKIKSTPAKSFSISLPNKMALKKEQFSNNFQASSLASNCTSTARIFQTTMIKPNNLNPLSSLSWEPQKDLLKQQISQTLTTLDK